MIFTVGNIITLVVAVAMILVFRQLDSNNRSLEKVKKFTEKLKSDLDGHFEQRSQKLQDMVVGLEVQQTQAIATVKRLDKIKEDFLHEFESIQAKVQDVAGIGVRINQYDETLKHLTQMTANAEENLQRLTAESKFADSLQKKLNAAQEQLEKVNASIPAFEQRFTELNEHQLERALEKMLDIFEPKIETASDHMDKIADTVEQSFHVAAEKADKLEHTIFEKLQEKVQERFVKYQTVIEDKTQHLQDMLKARIEETQNLAKSFRTDWKGEAESYLQKMRAEMAGVKSDVVQSIAETDGMVKLFKADWQAEAESYLEKTRAEMADVKSDVVQSIAETDSMVKSFKAGWQAEAESYLEKTRAEMTDVKSDVVQCIAETGSMVKSFKADWKAEADSYVETTRHDLSDLKIHIDAHFEKEQQAITDKSHQLQDLLKIKVDEVKDVAHSFNADWKASADVYLEKTRTEIAELYGRAKELDSKLSGIFIDYETQLQGYQKDILFRFDRLDAINADTDQLETELRRSMEITSNKVTASFEQFTGEQKTAQVQFEKVLQDEETAIRQRMHNLETDLNDLKAKAYGNVSQNLKVFEDDFFADLTKRSESVNVQLKKWKIGIDDTLASLATESEDGRHEVERQYTEHLKEKLQSFADKYREQMERIEHDVGVSEENIRTRVSSNDSALHMFIEQYRVEFDQARSASEEYLKNEFDAYAVSVQEQLRKQERETASQLNDLNGSILVTKQESSVTLDSIRDEVASWKLRVDQQIAETKDVFGEKLANLDTSASDRIVQIVEHFNSEYAAYTGRVESGYNVIVVKLQDLQSLMGETSESFEKRSKSANADFEKTYASLLDDIQQRMRTSSSEADAHLRTLKSLVQETSEKTEVSHDRMLLKVQTDINALTATLDDADKRIKYFVAQTQLFDRADVLKEQLEAQLADLRGEVSKVENHRQTLTDIEQQFTKIRKLEDELSQRMARFFEDKKRIEILESDFNKLLALSSSMDKKIAELTTTSDDLQLMQMNVRRFQDSLADVSVRYERLEKKTEVLDQTALGVDKAFESLKAMEKNLQSYSEQAGAFPTQIMDLKRGVEQLLDNERKVRTVVAKLEGLDKVLLDTEKRTENMQVAREWLARTETRMQEVSKEAQEKLNLFQDLLKSDNPVKKDRGAPPPSIRETVIKLSHSGWKIDEIARTTKLSRGEVELILELNPDK